MTTTHFLPFIERLNPQQKEAVLLAKRHLRVLAGAGSGKTQVLVCRIAALIQLEGLIPEQFIAVTFTNKAAHEMKSRLGEFIQQSPQTLWVGTFHHLAHRILRKHHQAAKLPSDFQIIDSADQQRRIKRIIRNMNLDEARFSAKTVQSFISQQKDNALTADQAVPSFQIDPYQKTLASIYKTYEAGCRSDYVLDFSDLLLQSRALLEQHPDILQEYHQRFRYVLVDEFQDTSLMQYEWIRLLVGPNTYLTIVGDDDQSIYGWRGAQIENMHRFEKDFCNSQTIRLEQNYRSTNTILSAANALIANNRQRLGKNLWTDSNQGDRIQVYESLSDMDEANFIIKQVEKAKKEGTDYDNVAVLYRSNAQSRIIEEALIQANIPYRVYGGLRFFDRSEIKETLAYLRLVNEPNDNMAFERVVNTPARGIGTKTIQAIRDIAAQKQLSYYNASRELLQANGLPSRGAKALHAFLQLIHQLNYHIEGYSLDKQIDIILKESGLLAYYEKDHPDQAQTRLENVNELVKAARQFMSDTGEELLSSFINKMTLDTSEYQNKTDTQPSIQLMTLHAAKGLEFPIVFLTGLEEGLFPSHLSLTKPSDVEEERRLCYVGITRAMQQLYLTYAKVRAYHGTETYRIPSRFIEEIPKEYLSFVRHPSINSFQYAREPSRHVSQQSIQIGDTSFRLYQKVRHPSFGVGVITDHEGEGMYARVKVKFDTSGAKWLVLHFAKLESYS